MSNLLYTPLVSADYPWAISGDRILSIDSGQHAGKHVVVNIVQATKDINFDGVADLLTIVIYGRLVDIDTGETIKQGTVPLKTNLNNHSITIEALNSDPSYLDSWVMGLMDDEIFKVLRLQTGLVSWALIPQVGV